MKLAHYLPLALVAAASGDGVPPGAGDDYVMPCATEIDDVNKCGGGDGRRAGGSGKGEPVAGRDCMECLEDERRRNDEDLDAAVAVCTALDAPCKGCEEPLSAMTACALETLRGMHQTEL